MDEKIKIMNKQPYYFYPAWDILLRILHWWNAATMLLQIATGSIILIMGDTLQKVGGEWLIAVHSICGYLFAAGVFTRILWLFVGSPSASWRDILPLTANQRKVLVDTLRYYISGLRGAAPLYKAHNPFAGLVYAGFLALAAVQAVVGAILLYLPPEQRDKSILLDWHETGYFLLILYVAAHVFAVFVHELAERHGLIPAMIHGKKTFTEEEWQTLNPKEEKV